MNMDLKEQIIYVDNKPHIKAKVVMLSTNKKIEIEDICIANIGMYRCTSQHIHWDAINKLVEYKNSKPQHLYIISNEEIKEGDYFLTNQNDYWKIQKCQKICDDGMIMSFEEEIAMFQEDTYFVFKPELCKKIFATTDKSLGLPQPSQQFIEKYIEEYNKGNIITNILVEVEPNYNQLGESIWELKLDSQNQITIRKQKDSWSRKEVIDLISDWTKMKSGLNMNLPNNFNQWIEENL